MLVGRLFESSLISSHHYKLAHTLVLLSKAMETGAATTVEDEEWDKLQKTASVDPVKKFRSKQDVINGSKVYKRENIRCSGGPLPSVNTIPPNTEKWLRKFYMKTMATVYSYENEVNKNYSITCKAGTTRTSTSRPQSTTPMTTLTSTDAWRTCTESARTAHLFHSYDCLTLNIPWLKS